MPEDTDQYCLDSIREAFYKVFKDAGEVYFNPVDPSGSIDFYWGEIHEALTGEWPQEPSITSSVRKVG